MRSVGRDKIVAYQPITSLEIDVQEGCRDFDFWVDDVRGIDVVFGGRKWRLESPLVLCQVVAPRWKPKGYSGLDEAPPER